MASLGAEIRNEGVPEVEGFSLGMYRQGMSEILRDKASNPFDE